MEEEITSPGYIPNAPDIEVSGDEYTNSRPAIANDDQVQEIVMRVDKDASKIIRQAAKIQRKIDGIDPPLSPYLLKQEGKAWKTNIPTGFMQTVAGRVAPRLYSYLDNARYLINVNLPSRDPLTGQEIPNAYSKSIKFQEIFTETLRGWLKFHAFEVGLANEVGNYGFAFAAFLDDYDWRPRLYRLDRGFVPTGTEIMEDEIAWFVTKDEYKVHELFDKIVDREAAEETGWDIDATLDAINKAMPVEKVSDGEVEGQQRTWEDMKRECVPGYSYRKNVQTIKCRNLLAMEYDGTVSHFIFAENTQEVIYRNIGRFQSMQDVVVPFTFQYGNGTIYGSYGVGQQLYDLSLGIERARNDAFDQLINKGKLIIQVSDASSLNKVKTMIYDEMIAIAGGTLAGNAAALSNNAEAFERLDRYFTSLAEQKVGAFLPPPVVPGANVTATQAGIAAQREDETRLATLNYWLRNWAVLAHAIARRMFNPMTTELVALRAQEKCLKFMSEEEMVMLANTSPTATILEFTDQRRNEIVAFTATKIGNPLYNQTELERIQAAAAIGEDLATALIIPAEDQTILAEASRQQMIELNSLEQGIQIPISRRDNDPIHMAVLRGEPDQMGQYNQGPIVALLSQGNMQGAQTAFVHYLNHYTQAEEKKVLGEQINMEREFIGQMRRIFQQAQEAQAQQQPAVFPQGAMPGEPM